MKKFISFSVIFLLLFSLTACNTGTLNSTLENATKIVLNDNKIMADSEVVSTNKDNPVYIANDIIYYESGKDFTYGEGSESDAHSADEAALHTVVHITKAGTYSLEGKLSAGQIAVDLGEDAKEDKNAVVTLILNEADITCSVAPAIIFYNVYECSSDDTENASKEVDTSLAGANVIIADGTANTINGSYVARIYKPDTVVLNEEKSEVEDAKKLHKYDGALYSKMSMNVNGGKKGTGKLTINAENEGLNSELHLTLNGGIININSGNDGINTNCDEVSVTTVNGGELNIRVTGETGEGDGIDSNGWLVINGGKVTAEACSDSADAGIDSDMGIHINGGTVAASGNMLDKIESTGQTYAVFQFNKSTISKEVLSLKDKSGTTVFSIRPQNNFSVFIYSSPSLEEGSYTLYSGDTQLAAQGGMNMGPMRPEGNFKNEIPEGEIPPEMPEGIPKQDFKPDFTQREPTDGETPPERAEGDFNRPETNNTTPSQQSTDFVIKNGENMFGGITSQSF